MPPACVASPLTGLTGRSSPAAGRTERLHDVRAVPSPKSANCDSNDSALVIEPVDGVVELGLQQLQRMVRREPPAERLAGLAPDSLEPRARSERVLGAFTQENHVLRELVQVSGRRSFR